VFLNLAMRHVVREIHRPNSRDVYCGHELVKL
jgi:hypothetical protein